jgi:cleavage stimulation factor subunit 3
MVDDRSAGYMLARAAYKERRPLLQAVNRRALARPPRGTAAEERELRAWQAVLQFERRNGLRSDDGGVARTVFAYRQCLSHLRYDPEVWHEAAQYLHERARADEAAKMYREGMDALPHRCAYADLSRAAPASDCC